MRGVRHLLLHWLAGGMIFCVGFGARAQHVPEWRTELERERASFRKSSVQQRDALHDFAEVERAALIDFRRRFASRLRREAEGRAAVFLEGAFARTTPAGDASSENADEVRRAALGEAFVTEELPRVIAELRDSLTATYRPAGLSDAQRLEVIRAGVEDALIEPEHGASGVVLRRLMDHPKVLSLTAATTRDRVSSYFGSRRLRFGERILREHCGIDVPMPVGSELRAPADGTVVRHGHAERSGRFVTIRTHTDPPLQVSFSHLSEVSADLAAGRPVYREKTLLGRSGNTGLSTGPHVHIAVREDVGDRRRFVNPVKWMAGIPSPKQPDAAHLQYQYCDPLTE